VKRVLGKQAAQRILDICRKLDEEGDHAEE